MPDPLPYEPGYDFTASDKGAQLNMELANVAEATEQLAGALMDIRRSDGALKNGVVTADALATTALAALGPNGDLTVEALAAATASATAAANSATTAGGAATTAANSAAAAANSAGTAAGFAEDAEVSANAASVSAAAAVAAATPVAFAAYRNAVDQTGIAPGVATKIVADVEVFDRGEHYDTALGRWTPPTGRYWVSATALFTANVVNGEQYRAMLYVNGALARQAVVVANGTAAISVSVAALLSFDGDDYVEFFVRGDGAGDKTISGSSANTWFDGSAL